MTIAKPLILIASIALALFILEGGLRLVYEPVDFLKPNLISDEVLGWRIEPGSGGHDEWGFRNESVPDRVDVVAIGDSQTYGYAAVSNEEWPSWYADQSDQSIYNMGIGGYGPAEYRYLLETKALSLNPKIVLVGLYLGNDLFDVDATEPS